MKTNRPRRAVLYVPASNEKALAKAATLACDAVIIDLEDAVAPGAKQEARERMRAFMSEVDRSGREWIVRINQLSGEWGTEDFLAARGAMPDAILLPKVEGPVDILMAEEALEQTDAPEKLALWAMVETPRGMIELPALAAGARRPFSRLGCLVAGTNDLVKETGLKPGPGRANLMPWLLQMVLAARAGGLDVLDGVSNDFRDLDAFATECRQGAELGFDGKTLIHPAQIEVALAAFSPSVEEIAEATRIVAAFGLAENAGKGVISLDGRMVERLHLEQADKLLAKADHNPD
ncbi:HpcH/HpaI aldolase/citrate lyase family protein [Chelativorans sp. ZYF759]|uniref:HpcH/HpaI aldolase/citrate lyase family protein n=1 Tax=Chelativorans sp. ZYF759 TaxID=2692213 RepID=UPI00145D475A|nr:CoA ester lyase [Chelativorans sp. ZYF759]NMG38076.1 HpcH/HpaI aldolase/citrate lyase family protein [Chelativorans sp. ZYF759]